MVVATFDDVVSRNRAHKPGCIRCHSSAYVFCFGPIGVWRCVDCHINFDLRNRSTEIILKEK